MKKTACVDKVVARHLGHLRRSLVLIFALSLALTVGLLTPNGLTQTGEIKPLWSYQVGDDFFSVAISSDGRYVAARSRDGYVYFFGDNSGKPQWSYFLGNGDRNALAISADGRYVAAADTDRDLRLYLFDRVTGRPLWSYQKSPGFQSLAISGDGQYLAAGCWDGTLYLFNRDSGTPLWSYSPENKQLWLSVAISSDGQYVAIGSTGPGHGVYLFSRNTGRPLWSYQAESVVTSVAVSGDGQYVAVGDDSRVYLFRNDRGAPLWRYQTGGGMRPVEVAISSDGRYVVAGSGDENVYLFNRDSSTPLWNYDTDGGVVSVAISADGQYIAAGSWISGVYLFGRDGTPLWVYGTGSYVERVAISSDGRYVAAASQDGRLYVFMRFSSAGASLQIINKGQSANYPLASQAGTDYCFTTVIKQNFPLALSDTTAELVDRDLGSKVDFSSITGVESTDGPNFTYTTRWCVQTPSDTRSVWNLRVRAYSPDYGVEDSYDWSVSLQTTTATAVIVTAERPPQTASAVQPAVSALILGPELTYATFVAIGAIIGLAVYAVSKRRRIGRPISAEVTPVRLFEVSVNVPSVGKTVTLEVASDHTVGSLVETLTDTLNLPKGRAYAVDHAGKLISQPEFGKTLSRLGLKEGTKLSLVEQ